MKKTGNSEYMLKTNNSFLIKTEKFLNFAKNILDAYTNL